MKTAEYKLPAGVHPLLEPVQTGTTPTTKGKDGKEIPGKPIFEYRTIKLPEAETLQEFIANLVEQDKPEDHTLALAQGQYDIIAQRKVREFCQSQEVSDMLDGKHADTKDLTEDQRIEHVLGLAQEIADTYKYGSRPAGTGGQNAAAKKALDEKKKIEQAAQENPEVAAKLAELQATLAGLGINL